AKNVRNGCFIAPTSNVACCARFCYNTSLLNLNFTPFNMDNWRLNARHATQLSSAACDQILRREVDRVPRLMLNFVPKFPEIRIEDAMLVQSRFTPIALILNSSLKVHAAFFLKLCLQLTSEIAIAFVCDDRESIDQRIKTALAV